MLRRLHRASFHCSNRVKSVRTGCEHGFALGTGAVNVLWRRSLGLERQTVLEANASHGHRISLAGSCQEANLETSAGIFQQLSFVFMNE